MTRFVCLCGGSGMVSDMFGCVSSVEAYFLLFICVSSEELLLTLRLILFCVHVLVIGWVIYIYI